MARLKYDLTGQRFGRLSVLSYAGADGIKSAFTCLCDCGTVRVFLSGNLRTGRTTSCGCAHSDELRARNTTHGQRESVEHRTWCNIRARCNNPRSVGYENYGARGIKVCERWDDFSNFLSDMGTRPSADHSIDRIDVNGDYEPANCRWATRREQMANMRRNVHVVINGERMIQAEAARRLGVTANTIKHRQRMEAMRGH